MVGKVMGEQEPEEASICPLSLNRRSYEIYGPGVEDQAEASRRSVWIRLEDGERCLRRGSRMPEWEEEEEETGTPRRMGRSREVKMACSRVGR